jgi:hypothetical protein
MLQRDVGNGHRQVVHWLVESTSKENLSNGLRQMINTLIELISQTK